MQEKHEVIKERLRFVRERMKAENVDIFVVFTDDYHMSEYSGAYFADREYLSGFTGSAGTLAVTQTEAALLRTADILCRHRHSLKVRALR